jgi:hypothetical protein
VIGFNPKPNLKPKANFIFKKTQATKKSYPWPPKKEKKHSQTLSPILKIKTIKMIC